jgi:CRISPR-associated protein Csm3
MEKLEKKIIIKSKLRLETGLHVGGSKDSVEIGGIDNPVIKIGTKKNQPFIPGSSLKGKLRSLLEQIEGCSEIGGGTKKEDTNGKKVDYKFEEKPKQIQEIINLFGFSNDNKPSKIIVRDAELTDESIEELEKCDFLDMPYTESKYENTIDRVTGITVNGGIRQTERVPAGVVFMVEFVINVWSEDNNGKALFDLLAKAIKALELDYLGGSGSRGYGKVQFIDFPESFEKIDTENIIDLAKL